MSSQLNLRIKTSIESQNNKNKGSCLFVPLVCNVKGYTWMVAIWSSLINNLVESLCPFILAVELGSDNFLLIVAMPSLEIEINEGMSAS